ncbi:copper chaperone PCu(A)C [Pseudomonas cavernae]|uniref:Copper chaperone PCu(A)C n=1 Tax=Pseudomonas cavernae TaxID=2320867 RepID=A0A385Z1P4_9PSED|nr:copper chaperone PCu(A)C [Pseudomonas cavernae]AYC31572.1 copper chaperone PCu(A)C [Pseudomonas cavernae]
MRRLVQLGAAVLLSVSTTATADLQVSEAKLRLLPGDLPAAGYFTLTNNGSQPVVLSGAQSPAFAQVMMHRSSLENGMASMQPIEQLEIPAGATLTFASGGYHLMLIHRQRELALGDQVEVNLQFADGQSLPVTLTAALPTALRRA